MRPLNSQLLLSAFDGLPAATAILDLGQPGWPVAHANPAFYRLLDGDAGALAGLHWLDVADPQLDGLTGEAALTRLQGGPCSALWLLHAAAGGSVVCRSVPLFEKSDRPAFLLLSVSDDSAAAGSEAGSPAARRSFSTQRLDPVTGLPPGEAFLDLLTRDWRIARRTGRRINVILFRVDALESYRALFGRHAADSCLKRVGHLIASCLRRAGDSCARYDEDSFAVLADGDEELKVRELAARIAERVRSLAIHHPRSQSRFLTVSCGIASEVPARDAAEQTLVTRAREQLSNLPVTLVEGTGCLPAEGSGRRFGAS